MSPSVAAVSSTVRAKQIRAQRGSLQPKESEMSLFAKTSIKKRKMTEANAAIDDDNRYN